MNDEARIEAAEYEERYARYERPSNRELDRAQDQYERSLGWGCDR